MASGSPPPLPPTLDDEILRMRRNAGDGFERFVKAFAVYTHGVTIAVTNAPADQVLGAQGQARAHLKLLQKFEDALKQ